MINLINLDVNKLDLEVIEEAILEIYEYLNRINNLVNLENTRKYIELVIKR